MTFKEGTIKVIDQKYSILNFITIRILAVAGVAQWTEH